MNTPAPTITIAQLKANFEEFAERAGIEHKGYFEHPGQTSMIPGWYLEKSLDKYHFRIVSVPSDSSIHTYPIGQEYRKPMDLYLDMDAAMMTLDQGTHS